MLEIDMKVVYLVPTMYKWEMLEMLRQTKLKESIPNSGPNSAYY